MQVKRPRPLLFRSQFEIDLVLELLALPRNEPPVTFGIDPRIHALGRRPLLLAFEIEVLTVCCGPDVWLEILESMQGIAIITRDPRVRGIFRDAITRVESRSIREHDLVS